VIRDAWHVEIGAVEFGGCSAALERKELAHQERRRQAKTDLAFFFFVFFFFLGQAAGLEPGRIVQ